MIVLDEKITRARVQVREYRDLCKRISKSGTIRVFALPVLEVPGWTAIQTYKLAMLPDGQSLEALREGAE